MSDVATLARQVAELTARVNALAARVPVRIGRQQQSSVPIDVVQTAHGFTSADVGKAFTCAAGAWTLFSDYGASSYTPARPMWGILAGIVSDNVFRLVIGGEGVTRKTDLEIGSWYTFADGEPVKILGGYPPFEAASAGIAAMAISATSVVVSNDSRFQGLQSMDGTYTVVSHEDIGAGHYVVWAGVPSGQSPLALADKDNPWKWTNVGIALFEVGSAGSWLVLTTGTHEWSDYDNGDTRPAWMTTPPYNAGQRICLSESAPGQYATAEPAFKVYAGISSASYTPADPPNPEATTFSARAVGQGVVYPIPPWAGGTGTDVSALDEHSVLFMDTYGSPASRKIAGLLSATANFAVIAQKNNEPPTHLSLDLATSGSFVVDLGTLYAAACGKLFSLTAPTATNQFLKFDGTEWAPFFLLDAVGRIPSWDGTDYIQVDASLSTSVLGNPTNTIAPPTAIAAAANDTIFGRRGNALNFAKVSLAAEVSGTLPKGNGGTSATNEADARQSLGCIKGVIGSTLTTSGTYVVPAGVYRVLILWAAPGGGKASGGPGTGIMMYVAATSGGPTTYQVDYDSSYAGGGDGGMGMAWVDVTPGETLTITIGTVGSGASYPGGNGGNTTIDFPSSGGTLTATGGRGAYPAEPGDAGYITSSVASARNPVVVDLMSNGGIGSSLLFKDSGGSVIGGWASTGKSSKKSLIPNTTYGKGGTTGSGEPGVVQIIY